MGKRSDITAAILAGGQSSRMGRDKAMLTVSGRPFIQEIAGVLTDLFETVVVSSSHAGRYDFLGLPVIADSYPGCGPLAGIHSTLRYAGNGGGFVASCDLPLLRPELIQTICDSTSKADVILFETAVGPQPLCALYQQPSLPVVEKHLRNRQYSVLRCLRDLHTLVLPLPAENPSFFPNPLLNVNTPADYRELTTGKKGNSPGRTA